jgi:hypothetical protein
MTVTTAWTDPSAGGTLDLSTGGVVTETIWDAMVSNFLHLGGSKGTIGCRLFHSPAQATTNVTATVLVYAFERFDTDTMHDSATNPGRITFNTAGVYAVGGETEYDANATGQRYLTIRLNGTTPIASQYMQAATGGVHRINVMTFYRFAVTDYIELLATQSSGGTLNTNSTPNTSNEFWAIRLGV